MKDFAARGAVVGATAFIEAGCLFTVAAGMTVQHPPDGALFFLMPVVAYWRELRAIIRRARH